ncbi:hypothetical protein ACHAQD_011150 [Fusarium lateritium]
MYSGVFLIIDALDEWQTSRGYRTRFISELFNLQAKFRVRIFATSTYIPEIVSCFKAGLSKEIEIRASSEDVARYLQGHMVETPLCVRQNQQLQEDITRGISEVVDGMFLLARLYLELLFDKLTSNDIRSAVETFRKENQGLGADQKDQALALAYDKVMERINGQMPGMKILAMKVLSWITCAKRQLTTSELRHALATKTGKFDVDHGDLNTIEDIVSVCAGLVTVDKESNIIRLVHYTTQQYLERTLDFWVQATRVEVAASHNPVRTGSMTMTIDGLGQAVELIDYTKREYLEKTQGSGSTNANAEIAKSCLTYLLFPAFNVDFSSLNEYLQGERYGETPYPFLGYCLDYGAEHARLAPPESPFITRFFSSGSDIIKNWLLMAATNGGPQAEATTEWLLERGACIDMKDSEWKTPLHHAVLNGWKRCVLLLLQREASLGLDIDNMTPFHYTVKNGNQEIAQIFLDAGIPIDLTVRRRVITRMSQTETGRVTYCIEDNAQSAARSGSVKEGLTSLHLATLTGCREMTKFLLEHCADPNHPSDHGETALHLALKGELSGPRCLASRDFWNNPDTRIECILDYLEDEERRSTRLWAIGVRMEIINILLEQPGINVNAQDISGISPLHVASGKGSPYTFLVQKLIRKGARVSIQTKEGKTPLHLACLAENEDNLTTLLDSGADPTECDEKGANALHYAARCRYKERIRIVLGHVPHGIQEAFTKSQDKQGKNALHYLLKGFIGTGGVGGLKLLLEWSAGVNELDQKGMSPTATFLGAWSFLQTDEYPEVLRLLFEHGADPCFKTKEGLNLVHLAVKSGKASTAVLRVLATQKVDMRARDRQGRTAFHHGAISGRLTEEGLCCLRDEFQLSTEVLDEQGKTALAYAVEKEQEYHHPDMFDPSRWRSVQALLSE